MFTLSQSPSGLEPCCLRIPASVRIMSRMAYKIHGIGGPSLVVLVLTGAFMLFYRGVTWQSIIGGEFFADEVRPGLWPQVSALSFFSSVFKSPSAIGHQSSVLVICSGAFDCRVVRVVGPSDPTKPDKGFTNGGQMAIRIIHVGTGSRGRHWLEIVRDYPEAISVAFVDKDPQALD